MLKAIFVTLALSPLLACMPETMGHDSDMDSESSMMSDSMESSMSDDTMSDTMMSN